MSMVSPYIMVTRNTSSNLFRDTVEITEIEKYIREKRKQGLTSFGIMHVIIAAYVRPSPSAPPSTGSSRAKRSMPGTSISRCLWW